MYAKEELTWCNRFGTAHIVAAQSQKHREYTSNSYPSFIDIPQPVTNILLSKLGSIFSVGFEVAIVTIITNLFKNVLNLC